MKGLYRAWLWVIVIAIFATAAMAQSPGCRSWPEARAKIEAALAREGVAAAVTGELPCQFAAAIPAASSLHIVKLWQDSGGSHASFRCQAPASCLPFVVETAGVGTQPAWSHAPVMRHAAAPAPVLVKSGQPINLLWEQGNLRLTRVMISLDSGRAGDRIRTRARDGGPIVPGRVIAPGWARARE